MTTLEKIRAEIKERLVAHNIANTLFAYEILEIIDKYAEQEPTDVYDKVLAYLKENVDDFPDYHEAIEAVLEMKGGE